MRPITVTALVDAPRERVFDYIADIANHAEFMDGYVDELRLERVESRGVGAGARYRIGFPLGRLWADCTVVESERPHLVRLEGRMGRLGRIETAGAYRLTLARHDMTKVEYTFSAHSTARGDRLRELLGFRLWLAGRQRRALARLSRTLEEGRASTHAATVAAG